MATTVANLIPLTGNPFVDGLVQGSSWQFGGGEHTLTYSLSINDTPIGGNWVQRSDMAVAVMQAMTAWSNVADVSFVQAGSGGVFTRSIADVAVVLTGNELINAFGTIGLGLFPDHAFAATFAAGSGYSAAAYSRPEGDVFFDNYSTQYNNVTAGSFGFQAVLHELGHALGLKDLTDDGGNGRPTYAELGISAYDNGQYSVMSPQIARAAAATPMPFDIAAIQSIYGANMSSHTGDDTYRLQNYDNAIWDAGGVDTLNASSGLAVTIDLRPGAFSFVNSNPGPVTAIAFGVTIENAVGSNADDTIIGNDAANTIDGRLGADTMSGGKGNDTYLVDNIADVVRENAGEGIDTIVTPLDYTLPANVENLTLSGSTAINGTGNELGNIITGNARDNLLIGGPGNDTLSGGLGVDRMEGGVGDDTYVISDVFMTALRASGDPGDYITGGQTLAFLPADGTFQMSAADVTGDGLADTLTLAYLANTPLASALLQVSTARLGQNFVPGTTYTDAQRAAFAAAGHPGLDFVADSRGSNTVAGSFTIVEAQFDYTSGHPVVLSIAITFEQHSEGAIPAARGSFNYNVSDGLSDSVIELASQGVDTVQSAINYTLPVNVENLTLTGSSNLTGTGNTLNNVFTSNAGIDTFNGGAGDDSYIINSTSDVVNENPGEGTDTIQSYVPWTLGNNVENLTLLGSAAYGVGNENNNVITGDDADNPLLRGNGGADTIGGGGGNDWIEGDSGNDPLPFGQSAGNDTIGGDAGNDTLLGGDGNDLIGGGDGVDVLVGEGGNDTIFGGNGTDYIDGRQGEDWLFAGEGDDVMFGDGLTSVYGYATDTIHGENGDDIIMGESGDHNALLGGNDLIFGDDGNDLIYGGAGGDQILGVMETTSLMAAPETMS